LNVKLQLQVLHEAYVTVITLSLFLLSINIMNQYVTSFPYTYYTYELVGNGISWGRGGV